MLKNDYEVKNLVGVPQLRYRLLLVLELSTETEPWKNITDIVYIFYIGTERDWHLLEWIALLIMEADKYQILQSASWVFRRADGGISVWKLAGLKSRRASVSVWDWRQENTHDPDQRCQGRRSVSLALIRATHSRGKLLCSVHRFKCYSPPKKHPHRYTQNNV